MVKILTLNVRGFQIGGVPFKKRIGVLFEYINTTEVDELHLQEVYTYGMLRHLRRNLESHLPYVSFSRGLFGPKAGLVSFFRVMPTATTFHRLPESHLAVVDKLRLIPYIHKGMLATATRTGEMRFNLHLDPDHSGEWQSTSPSTRLIATQLDAVADVVLRFGEASFVIVGDFNLPTETLLYAEFVKRINAHDVMQGDTRPTFQVAFLPEGRAPRQIDHVLVASRGAVMKHDLILSKARDGVYVSDHLGILVTFREADG